jgi:hypothetical protein
MHEVLRITSWCFQNTDKQIYENKGDNNCKLKYQLSTMTF